MRRRVVLAAGALMAGFAGMSLAAGDQGGAASTSTSATLTAGEVRKIDVEQGKVTLKHEPIANLDMPAMTMVFRAQPAELLKGLQVGDKVRFQAQSANGALVVTQIQK